MNKNTIGFGLILLTLSTSSWASLYLGAGMGPDTADFGKSAIIKDNDFDVLDKTHLSGTGYFGTLFGGYDWHYKQLYIAGELNANVSTLGFKSSNNEYIHGNYSTVEYNVDHNYGISILPGYLFSDFTLFYGRLGYAIANFSIESTDKSLNNLSTNLSGFRFGFGVKQTLKPGVAVRMEYDHIRYESATSFALDNGVAKTSQITPATNQLEFGIVFSLI